MRQGRPLRPTRRPTGEQDDGGVVLVDDRIGKRRVVGSRRAEEGLELGHGDHRHVVGHPRLTEALETPFVGDDHLGPGQRDAVGQLGRRPPPVEAGHHRTAHDRGPPRHGIGSDVGCREAHPVARSDPVGGEEGRHSGRTGHHIGEAQRQVGKDQMVEIAVTLAGCDENGAQVRGAMTEHRRRDTEDILLDELEGTTRPDKRRGDLRWLPDVRVLGHCSPSFADRSPRPVRRVPGRRLSVARRSPAGCRARWPPGSRRTQARRRWPAARTWSSRRRSPPAPGARARLPGPAR